ncbi:MAG: BamA/TamA family outer membrane protein [Bacteroidales bacterium]|nr:BamA/TamA family outer membrane protein [Bacteroidales bacterium]
MKKELLNIVVGLSVLFVLWGCSATKHVPKNSYLLNEVKIHSDNKHVKSSDLKPYLRQNPNAKWFSLFKTPLYIYNLSGKDSTKWMNRFLRKIGDEPVIYSDIEADRTQEELQKAVQNMGFMRASVTRQMKTRRKQATVHYYIKTGTPYIVESIKYDVNDELIVSYLEADSTNSFLYEGMQLDINRLDSERERITRLLQNNGYYRFNKEFLTYSADTIKNTYKVDLTLHLQPYNAFVPDRKKKHSQYYVNQISFVTDFDLSQSSALGSIAINDSIHYKNYPIYYMDKLSFRPKILVENLRLTRGELYKEKEVQETYANYSRLSALKYTNIRFVPMKNDSTQLYGYVLLTKGKNQSVSLELDGTNSAGDLGAAAQLSYSHRNIFRGSETFTAKVRGAYEAITGLQPGYSNHNYREYGGELNLNFPRFLFPFLSSDFKQRINATTEFGLQFNYQKRPEFSRTVASTYWSYKWQRKEQRRHNRFDLLDVSYLYMPWISEKFKQDHLEQGQNYILEYNYKNRLIVSTGYSYQYNSAGGVFSTPTTRGSSYSIRASIESAGNLLYGLSSLLNKSKNSDDEYEFLGIPYAQYLKGDFDFSQTIVLDERNTIAYHAGLGIAVPYGNGKVIPFEKRYFSGGANSVRGWSVRELGPGSFPGDGNFLNQSGDIKFDASIEFRSRLFWKLHGALFVDAGNIWTLRDYEAQPGGKFRFNQFYKDIAVAYGLGLRLDLSFFVLRFDGGMKAINPAFDKGKDRYPIVRPKFSRDFAFHFAVGYPF